MGNIQSAGVDLLLSSFDAESETYDVILTYVLSHLIPSYMVEKMAWNWSRKKMVFDIKSLKRVYDIHKAGSICTSNVMSGSAADGLRLDSMHLDSLGNITLNTSDVDVLMLSNFIVSDTSENAREHGDLFYLDNTETYPGYARVKFRDVGQKFPAYFESALNYVPYQLGVLNGPAYSTHDIDHLSSGDFELNCRCLISQEDVRALAIRGWPCCIRQVEHISGLVRELRSQWKDQGVFCLVAAAHPSSRNPRIEWRISCSSLESLLCTQLTTSQRQIYLAFKYLVKEATNEHEYVKTYFVKTTFFWVLEAEPSKIWHEALLAQCLYLLLDKFIDFLVERNLPHYFIPENNLIGHWSEEQFESALNVMRQIRKYPIVHIMKFQKHSRLQCHNNKLQHGFERSLLLCREYATAVLDDYQICKQVYDEKIAYSIFIPLLIRQLDWTMLCVCAFHLIEGFHKDAFEKMILYNHFSEFLRHTSIDTLAPQGIPENVQDNLYRFLMYLCKVSIRAQAQIAYCMHLLKFTTEHLEQIDSVTENMTHKVKVIEAAVSSVSIQGIWPHDPARPQTTMDQCAVAFDSLIHEHKDVVTMCEYLCFFTNLWHYRSSSVGPRSFVLEARKFTDVTKIFVSAVELNANDNGELSRFHSVWKIVSMLDTLEPNLFQFLSQSDHSIHEVVFDFEYEIPHEIVGLFVTFLTMRRTLVPTARSLLKVGHPCNDCEDQSSHHKCDHSGISLQELLEDIIDLQNTVEKLFYENIHVTPFGETFRWYHLRIGPAVIGWDVCR